MTKYTRPPGKMKILGVLDDYSEAVAFMTPEAMKKLLFISNFESTDPDSTAPDKHGYQREPMSKRIPEIANYYRGGGARTTPLILSVRLIEPDEIDAFLTLFDAEDFNGIRERFGDAVMSVVDGQHRFRGLERTYDGDPEYAPAVPVLLNFGLTFSEEAEFFDLINSTQAKLPKALIEITKADVTEVGDMSHAQRIRLIATMLARHEDSVWHGEINLTGARDPQKPVTFEGLRRSMTSMFPKELLARIDALGMDVNEIARSYWSVVAESCGDAWNNAPLVTTDDQGNEVTVARKYRIKDLVGVASIARLGKDIISSALEHEKFDQKLASLTAKLSAVDWEKTQESRENPWMASQAGFAGQSDLYLTLYRWVYAGVKPE